MKLLLIFMEFDQKNYNYQIINEELKLTLILNRIILDHNHLQIYLFIHLIYISTPY